METLTGRFHETVDVGHKRSEVHSSMAAAHPAVYCVMPKSTCINSAFEREFIPPTNSFFASTIPMSSPIEKVPKR